MTGYAERYRDSVADPMNTFYRTERWWDALASFFYDHSGVPTRRGGSR